MYDDHEYEPESLSPREWQVFELLRRGFEDHQIAQVLGITEPEAAGHVASILAKLPAASRQEIVAWQPYPESAPTAPRAPGSPRRFFGSVAGKVAIGAFVVFAALAIAVVSLVLLSGDDSTVRAPEGEGEQVRPPTGDDHWHAALDIEVCGELQPPVRAFAGGVHTHADGFIHIHPNQPSEEGIGASLGKFFEYGGGVLTERTLQVPGSGETYRNGDTCPDGSEGKIRVAVNGNPVSDFPDYIPQDADAILITFGP